MLLNKYMRLLGKAFKVRGVEFLLAVRGIKNWRIRFVLSEIFNWLFYLRRSPYRVSRRFHEERGDKDIYCYGETPLITLRQIADAVSLSASDMVVDAGSGTGRNAFWFHSYAGCRMYSIEQIGEFVVKCRMVAKMLHCSMSVRFIYGDFLECEWGTPSVVYLYNFMLDEEELACFARRCAGLKVGVRIVTVSISLMDYLPESFELKSSFKATFPWGETDVYVCAVK